jgi:DNA-binding response OmpR family regulator
MQAATRRSGSFGDFTLDAARCAVMRGGREIPPRSGSFENLRYLVEHHGVLVTKEDLRTNDCPILPANR